MSSNNNSGPLQQIQLANLKDRIEAARHRQRKSKHVNEYERLMDAKFYGKCMCDDRQYGE